MLLAYMLKDWMDKQLKKVLVVVKAKQFACVWGLKGANTIVLRLAITDFV